MTNKQLANKLIKLWHKLKTNNSITKNNDLFINSVSCNRLTTLCLKAEAESLTQNELIELKDVKNRLEILIN